MDQTPTVPVGAKLSTSAQTSAQTSASASAPGPGLITSNNSIEIVMDAWVKSGLDMLVIIRDASPEDFESWKTLCKVYDIELFRSSSTGFSVGTKNPPKRPLNHQLVRLVLDGFSAHGAQSIFIRKHSDTPELRNALRGWSGARLFIDSEHVN